MKEITIFVIEAFTSNNNSPFTGNTAAVCFLDSDDIISDETKQSIAFNMNLSETAFISKKWRKDSGDFLAQNEYTLRWFTPRTEVPLCGHGTLASAKAIIQKLNPSSNISIKFHSLCHGELGAFYEKSTENIVLDFPSLPPSTYDFSKVEWFNSLLKSTLGDLVHDEILLSKEGHYLLIRLKSREDVLKVEPDFVLLAQIDAVPLFHGVIVTARDGEKKNLKFYSRVFCPWSGIDEDPVTGSAHSVLTPYWSNEFSTKIGLNAVQLSERTGELVCSLNEDSTRVALKGNARVSLIGKFIL